MTEQRERYRKLPGHRRGIIHGSSVWLGSDHLLFVKSLRFREEYKKFFLRDIQAIAVAAAPRFHISSRSLLIAFILAWLCIPFGVVPGARFLLPYIAGVAATLIATWILVSAAYSCRCRIYTAVSSDELPSVYRAWTARKFLRELEPRIGEAQGVIEGQWAEAAETRNIGPPVALGPAGAPRVAVPIQARGRSHTTISDIFIGTLFASGAAAFLTLGSAPRVAQTIWVGFLVLKVIGATGIFVQHSRGVLKPAMQRLALATLLLLGGMYYLEQITVGVSASASQQKGAIPIAPLIASGSRVLTETSGAVSLILGCIGLGIIFLSHDAEETGGAAQA